MNGLQDRLADRKKTAEAGATSPGKTQLLRHLCGEKLSIGQAVKAKCFDCSGGYADGKQDCRMPHCSLYPFMAYREEKAKKVSTRAPLSPEQREKLAANLARGRASRRAQAPSDAKRGAKAA